MLLSLLLFLPLVVGSDGIIVTGVSLILLYCCYYELLLLNLVLPLLQLVLFYYSIGITDVTRILWLQIILNLLFTTATPSIVHSSLTTSTSG